MVAWGTELPLGKLSRDGRYCVRMETPAPTSEPSPVPAAPAAWSRPTRWIVSLLLLWHVSAIVVGPAAVAPASGMVTSVWDWYRPYLDALYLNHGYHFFAPEPGPSHLIRYELTFADGSHKAGFFPHKTEHQPRLLYHRHFMLSEHFSQFAEPGTPPELLQAFSRSYAAHLLAEHHAQQVKLILVRHLLPQPEQVLAGMTLTDKSLYLERPLGMFKADGTAEFPATSNPPNGSTAEAQTAERLPERPARRR